MIHFRYHNSRKKNKSVSRNIITGCNKQGKKLNYNQMYLQILWISKAPTN